MKIQFTQDAEKERVKTRIEWKMFSSTNVVEAARYARDNGWYENRVQVRLEGQTYYVEPYEKGCGCRGLLRYLDYFEPPFDPL